MKLPGRMLIPWRKKTPPARMSITPKTLREIFMGIFFIGLEMFDDYTLRKYSARHFTALHAPSAVPGADVSQ